MLTFGMLCGLIGFIFGFACAAVVYEITKVE